MRMYPQFTQDIDLEQVGLFDFVRWRSPQWPGDSDLFYKRRRKPAAWSGITLACAIYGGLHATAWSLPFPTQLQQLLWRASSITVSTSAIYIAPMVFLNRVGNRLESAMLERGTQNPGSALTWILEVFYLFDVFVWLVFMPLGAIWYCLCRSFLVVESFINLAHLSADDLRIPTWPSYVPHIS